MLSCLRNGLFLPAIDFQKLSFTETIGKIRNSKHEIRDVLKASAANNIK